MNTPLSPAMSRSSAWELRFQSLFDQGRGLAFPCDAAGQVDLACLSERARANFVAAQSRVGREFATPCLARAAH